MRFLFAEGFSKYLLLGFFKFYKENPKFFLSTLSFPTIFLCVKDLEIDTGYF